MSELDWTAPVRLDQIGRGVTRRLVADDATRKAIAKDLDLASLDRLEADVAVDPTPIGWRLSGRIQADLVQTCGVTLEPLPAAIDADFSVEISETAQEEPESSADHELTLDTPDPPDVAENGVVDLAAYVVEHLALEIDPFPRKPGVSFEQPEGEAEPSPFAVLAQLKPKPESD